MCKQISSLKQLATQMLDGSSVFFSTKDSQRSLKGW